MDVTKNRSQHQIKNGDIILVHSPTAWYLCKKLTDKPLLVRLDSGNDSIDNVAVMIDTGCSFIIKRNLRKESKDEWFQIAKKYCQDITTPREGKLFTLEVTGKRWKVNGLRRTLPFVQVMKYL